MSTRVTSKGRITIPKKIRDDLRLKPKTLVEFVLAEDGRVIFQKAGQQQAQHRSVFARLRGTASGHMTTDEILALTRGPGPRPSPG